jgi:catechol 2,3-dioxygenase-like lactoylglutathione lyase family enzyme
MKFGHLGFSVKDFGLSKKFYQESFAGLGLTILGENEKSVRFGHEGRTVIFIHTHTAPSGPFHFAFEVDSKEKVEAFYTAALAAGGKDNGAPGIRENYSPTYFAAFVIDPDGNNIEVVCR